MSCELLDMVSSYPDEKPFCRLMGADQNDIFHRDWHDWTNRNKLSPKVRDRILQGQIENRKYILMEFVGEKK